MDFLKELTHHLTRHNISYEYDEDTIVIDFAEKSDESKYPVNYQIMEITYSPEKECFTLELSSTMNINDFYHSSSFHRCYHLVCTHTYHRYIYKYPCIRISTRTT